MQPLVVAALLAIAGCHLVFQAESAQATDAPIAVDAEPDAATAPCPAGQTLRTTRLPTVADAVLIDPRGGAVQAFGGNPNVYLNFGTSIKSVGIWRFATAGIATPPADWLAARVVLAWLPADDDCGPPACAPCNAFEEAGTFELYPIRAQWTEQVVSWTTRATGTPWSAPGADGGDRGAFAGSAVHVPREPLVFSLGAQGVAAIAPWVTANALSVVVVPKANPDGVTGARMLVPALPPRATCTPPDPPSYLEIDECR